MKRTLLLLVLVFLLGCSTEERIENQIEAETGEDAEVDIDGDTFKMTGTSDKGTYEIVGNNIGEDNWCATGAEWKFAGTNSLEGADAHWIIEGLETNGQFNGLCHVVFTFDNSEESGRMDYYFSEDGKSGYSVVDVNGEKITSEWHG